jgi:hypothetical protein
MTELVDYSLNEKQNINIFWFVVENVISKDKILILLKYKENYWIIINDRKKRIREGNKRENRVF